MKAPFNITILDPDSYIQRKGAGQVTTHTMFEASTSTFHPDGLFSEAIFGQVNSKERLVKHGFIDLKTTIMSPHLYKQLISLKGFYKDILSGKQNAYFDEKEKDFVKTTRDDPEGSTGYYFFISNLDKVEFRDTGSNKRSDKISLLEKYRNLLFMNKLLVIPAGLRDAKEDNGRISSEEINKLYLHLLSLTQAMPTEDTNDPVFDPIRYQIQNKVQQIYMYINDIIDGKGGFAQSKYAARNVALGARNVITAYPCPRVEDPDGADMLGIDETIIPLFQAMKSCVPLMVYKLKTIFFEQVFGNQTTSIPLIDTVNKGLVYKEVNPNELIKYTTPDGILSLIDSYRNPEIHYQPVSVTTADSKDNKYWLYLVYDDGNTIYTFRNQEDFLQSYGKSDKYHISDALKEKLDAYLGDIPPSEFIIGSGAACHVYDSDKMELNDVDVLLSDKAVEMMIDSDKFEVERIRKPGVFNIVKISSKDNEMEGFPISFDHDWKEALPVKTWNEIMKSWVLTIDGYQVMKPELALHVYRFMNRMKDAYKIDFLSTIVPDISKIRPMTYSEMFYLATYSATRDKHTTATRYPIINLEGIVMSKVHLVSTIPSRKVRIKGLSDDDQYVEVPHYPVIGAESRNSMSVHPATLAKYDGDHDGDVLSAIMLLSDESNSGIQKYMESPLSIVDANGDLIYGLKSGRIVRFNLFATSYHPL